MNIMSTNHENIRDCTDGNRPHKKYIVERIGNHPEMGPMLCHQTAVYGPDEEYAMYVYGEIYGLHEEEEYRIFRTE